MSALRVMGVLIYGLSCIGKTRAIEYVRLLIACNYPRMTSYHAQCEHKPRHAEGPFFANLLEAVGDPDPNAGSNTSRRMRPALRIREAAVRAGSGAVLLFCDEAQRYIDIRTRDVFFVVHVVKGDTISELSRNEFAFRKNSSVCTQVWAVHPYH
jgi:hypothetical protein